MSELAGVLLIPEIQGHPRSQQADMVMTSVWLLIGPSTLLQALKGDAQESTYSAGLAWPSLISVYSLSTSCVPGFGLEHAWGRKEGGGGGGGSPVLAHG